MKFSVVIPLYNKAAYIGAALDSALAQRHADFELIVVDDGSSDGSHAIVAACTDPRLRLVRQANAGVAAARNRGIALARGDWVCFLDADDWLHPACLSGFDMLIARHPPCHAVAARFRAVAPDWRGHPWPLPPPTTTLIDDLPHRWMQGIPFFTSSIAVRRVLLDAMQPCFPPGESCGEDLDLWFRIGERSPIALLEQPLAAYRIDVENSLSNAARDDNSRDDLGPASPPYLERLRRRAAARAPDDALRTSMLDFVAQQHITLARRHAAAGRRGQALRLLLGNLSPGLRLRRWWSTLLMALALPGDWICRWQAWREHRKAV